MLLVFFGCAPPPPVAGVPEVVPPAAEVAPVEVPEPPAAPAPPPDAPPAFAATARPLTETERAGMLGKGWSEGCPVPLDDLRRVELLHWKPDGTWTTGALVVAAESVDPLTRAFGALWAQRFPIERMEPIEAFGGSDAASMAANNTSAFNCRVVAGSSKLSRHAYGTAIDVNPLWNPWVKVDPAAPDGLRVDPPSGRPWADRTRADPGLFHAGSPAVAAFTDAGWKWGGAWTSTKDYQHFSADGN